VVDASVALKWLIHEPLRVMALDLIDLRIAIHAPSLILAEIEQMLWHRLRSGEIDPAHAKQISRRIPDYFDFLHPVEELTERTLDIALQLERPVYDCFYLACVQSVGLPLVTASSALLSAVRGTDFAPQVINLASIALARA
jgi:predicted nucleic acid-binding protein